MTSISKKLYPHGGVVPRLSNAANAKPKNVSENKNKPKIASYFLRLFGNGVGDVQGCASSELSI